MGGLWGHFGPKDWCVEKTKHRLINIPGGRWAELLQFALIGAAVSYLYAPVLVQLVANWWNDSDYSHGFLVPLLSAYFVWEKRHDLYDAEPQPNRWGILLLLVGLSILLLGNIGAELFLMRSSMLVVISGLVLYIRGWIPLKRLFFPLLFLLFMIPFPAIILNVVTFPLQLLAAGMATSGLELIGLPVYREGNVIFLPRITLEVVEACSGIRSIISLTALAVVFAYLTQRNIWKQSVLVVSAIPIAIGVNAFRILGTGVLAYLYEMKVAQDFYHTLSGWLIFVVAFGLLLVEGFVLSRLRFKSMVSSVVPTL